MANMGYCRFQNTLSDLRDCDAHMDDTVSSDEDRARQRLIKLCRNIANNYDDEYTNTEDEDEEDE